MLVLFLAIALSQNFSPVISEMNEHSLITKSVARPLPVVVFGLAVLCLSINANDVNNKPHQLYQFANANYPRFWLEGNFLRIPSRTPLPRPVVCKVNKYAPAFIRR